MDLKSKIENLKKEGFRLSGFEKRLIQGAQKKKEKELSESQVFWIQEIWMRIEKQKSFRRAGSQG